MVMTGTTTLVNTWHKETNIAPAVRDLGIRASLSEFLVEIGFGGLDAQTLDRPWRTDRRNRHRPDARRRLYVVAGAYR